MKEQKGNIWNLAKEDDWICVTTNGFVKNNGTCVMGRGIAAQAANKFPNLPLELGSRIKESGNKVFLFPNHHIISFPVKHNWWEVADLTLIKESCLQLKRLEEEGLGNGNIFIPRPGCGNGKLNWFVVKPILEEIFQPDLLGEDKFIIVSL